MRRVTLGIVLDGAGQTLLGEKKKGEIGTGILSGPGGKIEGNETPEACLLRETWEEWAMVLERGSLVRVAHIDFYAGDELFQSGEIFHARIIPRPLCETLDFKCPQWYPLAALPFSRMFESDRAWFSRAAEGESFRAEVHYRNKAKDFERIEFFPFDS